MKKNSSIQQQKMMFILIFAAALIGLGNGIGKLDRGLDFLNGLMIVAGTVGVVFSAIGFFKAK